MIISHDQANQLIEIVRLAARTEIMPRFRNLAAKDISTKTGPQDLVTIADRASEALISAAVAKIFPQAAIIGEEAVADNPDLVHAIGKHDLSVIIDPIDGTGNYASGLALFGVIVAVVSKGETVFGLLYDPLMDDWVMAHKGGGAKFCRPNQPEQQLNVREKRPISQSYGFMCPNLYQPAQREQIAKQSCLFGNIRELHCSCHEYRMLAMGQADFIVSPGLKPWDHAAGVLILHEAGGFALVNGDQTYSAQLTKGTICAATSHPLAKEVEAVLWE